MKSKFTLVSTQLRGFVSLARHGSYTRAAQDLRQTQSALSHAIQALERDLGVRLCLIARRELELTPAGKKILPHAREILGEMRRIRARAATARLPLPARRAA